MNKRNTHSRDDDVKISIRVPRYVADELRELLPWGTQAKVIGVLTASLVKKLRTTDRRREFIGAVATGDISAEDILKGLTDANGRKDDTRES